MECMLKKRIGRRNCRKCEEISCQWKIEPVKSYRAFTRKLFNLSPRIRRVKARPYFKPEDEENI